MYEFHTDGTGCGARTTLNKHLRPSMGSFAVVEHQGEEGTSRSSVLNMILSNAKVLLSHGETPKVIRDNC